MPPTPKIFFALLQNVSDLEMFKTKIKKIHKILTGNWVFSSLVDLGVDFSSQKLHVSPVYLLVMKWFN